MSTSQVPIPNIDLHRHLDGNVRVDTIWQLAQIHNIQLPANDREALAQLCSIQQPTSDLLSFLKKLDYGVSVLADLDACYRIAFENIHDAVSEELDYVELRFSPYYMALAHSLPLDGVVQAVISGCRDAAKSQAIKYNLIGILSRSYGVDNCQKELDALMTCRDELVAVDLAGDELGYPAKLFTQHFDQVKDAGLAATVHAGEADGAQSVWDAINLLSARRIGHGIASINDPVLMQYLVEHGIGIECCITSNYHTGVHTDMAEHPVKAFLRAGVLVSLNTDDPGVSNNTLHTEFDIARNILGLSETDITTLRENALQQSFLSEQDKQSLRQQKLP